MAKPYHGDRLGVGDVVGLSAPLDFGRELLVPVSMWGKATRKSTGKSVGLQAADVQIKLLSFKIGIPTDMDSGSPAPSSLE